jgi:electron transfer flavoprotein alpha subunit
MSQKRKRREGSNACCVVLARAAARAPTPRASISTTAPAASTLVLGEHAGGSISPATLATVTAASQIAAKSGDKDVTVLFCGGDKASQTSAAETASKLNGVTRVLVADSQGGLDLDHGGAEQLAPVVRAAAEGASHILASATTVGKDVLPRVAAQLDSQAISEITEVVDADTFVRPVYAGNALATVKSRDAVKALTVRATAFEKAEEGGDAAEIVSFTVPDATPDNASAKWVSDEEKSGATRPDLTSANIVVAGGRGLKNEENFQILYGLADNLGAAVGASRAAVDAGFCPNELQVGQTGKIVAPELYFAIGISGAIQHLAGMKDSKTIVAVNKDEDAPIFQVADYGIVGDLFDVVPELTEKTK